MKKSDYNKALLENFILWFTHYNREEANADFPFWMPQQVLANTLYDQIDTYIVEDHVDGVDGDDEPLTVDFYESK